MNNKLQEKLLNTYLNDEFSDAYVLQHKIDSNTWTSVVKPSNNVDGFEVLIGKPLKDPVWFSNGQYFHVMFGIFDITNNEFNEYLKQYVNQKYDLGIEDII